VNGQSAAKPDEPARETTLADSSPQAKPDLLGDIRDAVDVNEDEGKEASSSSSGSEEEILSVSVEERNEKNSGDNNVSSSTTEENNDKLSLSEFDALNTAKGDNNSSVEHLEQVFDLTKVKETATDAGASGDAPASIIAFEEKQPAGDPPVAGMTLHFI